jgi:hypothetical protein
MKIEIQRVYLFRGSEIYKGESLPKIAKWYDVVVDGGDTCG